MLLIAKRRYHCADGVVPRPRLCPSVSSARRKPVAYLKSLPRDAVLADVFKAFPDHAKIRMQYSETLMRGPSPLTPGERELIAAFVSGLNACAYCHGVHEATARAFGLGEGLMANLLADSDAAPVDERMKPILRYVKKLTLTPARMTQRDADAVFAAGWSERALHDAVSVCAWFNFMNRFVEGHGIKGDPGAYRQAAQRLHDNGYLANMKALNQA
jgi:uncharacterized peroxidase-related enzyme